MILVVLLQLMPQHMVAQEVTTQTVLLRKVYDQKTPSQNAFLSAFENSISDFMSEKISFDVVRMKTELVFFTQNISQPETLSRIYLPVVSSWSNAYDAKTVALYKNLADLQQQIKKAIAEQGYSGPIGFAIIKLD